MDSVARDNREKVHFCDECIYRAYAGEGRHRCSLSNYLLEWHDRVCENHFLSIEDYNAED